MKTNLVRIFTLLGLMYFNNHLFSMEAVESVMVEGNEIVENQEYEENVSSSSAQERYFNFIVGRKEFRHLLSTFVKEIKALNDYISFVEEQEESGDEESEEAESIEIDDLFPDTTECQENQKNFGKIIALLKNPASISSVLYSYSIKELLSLLKCVHKLNVKKIVKKCVKVCASYIENRAEIDEELFEFVESIPNLIPSLCKRIQVLSIEMPLVNISRAIDSLNSYHVDHIVCDNFSRRVAFVGNKKIYIIKSETKKVEVLQLPYGGKQSSKIFDLKFTSDGNLNMILDNKIYSYSEHQKKWNLKRTVMVHPHHFAVSDFSSVMVYRGSDKNTRISIAEEASGGSYKPSFDIILYHINQRWPGDTLLFDGCSTAIISLDRNKVAFGYALLGRVEVFDMNNRARIGLCDIPEIKNKALSLALNQDASLLGVKVKTSQEEIVYCANLALNSKIKQIYKKECDVDYEERCNSIQFASDGCLYVLLRNKKNKKSLVRFSDLATAKPKRSIMCKGDIDCFDISSAGLLAIGKCRRKNNVELYQLAPACLKVNRFSLDPHELQHVLACEREKFMKPAK